MASATSATAMIPAPLTQLILALPFTPGGLGVVEASLTALLVSYGTPAPSAIATVVLYRAITFWVLVPAGWVVWRRLDKRPSLREFNAASDLAPTPGTPVRTPLGRLTNMEVEDVASAIGNEPPR